MEKTNASHLQLEKSNTFQYVKIEKSGRRLFCLEQNLLVLAWVLLFKKDPISADYRPELEKISPWFVIAWLRNNFGLFRKNLRLIVIFAGYKYGLRKIDSVVRLSFYGQICVPVHKGYKIFDLKRGVVIKVFDDDVNASSISSEIEQLKNVSQIDFAPSIKRSNIGEKWYEEDYISGSLVVSGKAPDSKTSLNRFCHGVLQHLNSLMLLRQPETKNTVEYINSLMEVLEVNRLSNQALTIGELSKINIFLDSMVDYFRVEGNCPVFLVFTHGDFCPENMMNTKHGIKVIDWESATYRSALFDFYSYFFHRPLTYNIPINMVVSEIAEALPFLISRLTKNAPGISNSLLHLEGVYRRLYYIERICMLVERERTDKNLNIFEYVLRYLEAFNNYEEILIGDTTVVTNG